MAVPNLFYGKTLIELAQLGENKLLVLPEEEEDEDDESGGGDGDDNGNGNQEKTGKRSFDLFANK